MNLYKCRIGKISALTITCYGCGAIASHSIGRKEISISIASCCNTYRMGREPNKFAGNQVFGNNTTCSAIDDNNIFHLITCIEFDCTLMNLTTQCRISTEKQLLTGLSFGIERTTNLHTTERTVGKHTSIFTCKRHTLCYTLIDDVGTYFCQTIHIRLTGTIVATFDRIVEKTIYGIAIVLIVLCSIDTSLCCNRMSPTRRILYT